MANASQRPIRFSSTNPSGEPLTPQSILDIPSISYTARLASRNLLLVDPPPTGTLATDAAHRDQCLKRGKKGIVDEVGERKARERGRKRKRVAVFAREEARERGVWDVKPGTVVR
jgi:hypothetical protein